MRTSALRAADFANVFYSMTIMNAMIYATHSDYSCKPFADLSKVGSPQALTFTPDGSSMLVTITATEGFLSANTPGRERS